MKCIKEVNTEIILRVSDKVAEQRVNSGNYSYVSKSEHKDYSRKNKKEVQLSEDLQEIVKKKNSALTRSDKRKLKVAKLK